jgi:flagellar biosynthesis protein FlhG
MFAARTLQFVPLASNPQVIFGGVVLERLCAAFAAFGFKTLVFDAGERARMPTELSSFDLSEGIETLSAHVKYMPARGLPLKSVDARGDSGALLDVLAAAATNVDVVILHASASELVRVLAARAKGYNLRPLVFTDDSPAGLTQAYTAIKLMAQRGPWLSHDLLVCAERDSIRGEHIAKRLAHCADSFLHAAQHSHLQINPMEPATEDPNAAFLSMAADLLACSWKHRQIENTSMQRMVNRAALPSRLTPVFN